MPQREPLPMKLESLRAPDGTRLAVGVQRADGDGPVVFLIHGMLSHMSWYGELAAGLAREGIAVWVPDRRGSGRSDGPPGHVGSWRTLVADAVLAAREAARRHPGRALHALGLSFGAAVALAASVESPDLFRSLVLLAPGLAPRFRVRKRRVLRVLADALLRPRRPYDPPFSLDTLTERPAWRELMHSDPLHTRKLSARFLLETLRLQRFVRRRAGGLRVPVYALLAGADAVVDNRVVVETLSRSRAPVRIERFEGAGHMLTASLPREELLRRFRDWLRSPPDAAPQLVEQRVSPFAGDGRPLPDPPDLEPPGA